jgi:hypothetical protein
VCHRGIFDSGLEGFIAVDRRHRFDKEEGYAPGDYAEDEEGDGWTARFQHSSGRGLRART